MVFLFVGSSALTSGFLPTEQGKRINFRGEPTTKWRKWRKWEIV
jgi:hypothetical protein